MHRLTTIVDDLRTLDRPLRGDALVQELQHLNDHPEVLGWDPTTIAGEPSYRITRIVTDECRVFRTKARAPSLIVCECLREDLSAQQHIYSHNTHSDNQNHHSNHHQDNEEIIGHSINIGCIDNEYFGHKDESKDENKDGDGEGGDDQLFHFRSNFVVRPINLNQKTSDPDPILDPNLEVMGDPKMSLNSDLNAEGYVATAKENDTSSTTSISQPLSLSLPVSEPLPLDAPRPSSTTPPIPSTSPPRTGLFLSSPPISPPVSPTHLSPTKRKASLSLTPSHSQQDVDLANTIRTQVEI